MAIVTLARNLKLKVIAEGVETEEQLRLLRRLNCDEIQGYLFSKPIPPEALELLLLEGRLDQNFIPSLQNLSESLVLQS